MFHKKIIRMPLYEALWYFLIYAVLGWIIEVFFAGLSTGHFVNRGMLYGPYCPIYGFGMLIILLFLTPIQKHPVSLFFGAMLLTTALELVTGLALEYFFHERWWDYSMFPFNFMGHICLIFSIAWALGCVFIIRIIHPRIRKIVLRISRKAGRRTLIILYGVLFIDVCVTFSALILSLLP